MKKHILNTMAVLSFICLIIIGQANHLGWWMLPAFIVCSAYLGLFVYANYVRRKSNGNSASKRF